VYYWQKIKHYHALEHAVRKVRKLKRLTEL